MKKIYFLILFLLLSKNYALAKLDADTVLINLGKSTITKVVIIDYLCRVRTIVFG